jgi:hypothetical protein
MPETPVSVLLRTTGSLHNTVEANEFADHYPHESDYGTGRARPSRAHAHGSNGRPTCGAAGGPFESPAWGAETIARRWADTWSRARPRRDAEAIAALDAGTVVDGRPRSASRTREQDLLGYARPDPRAIAEEEARSLEGPHEDQLRNYDVFIMGR